ncbi:MAG TPA: hypothetical protein VH186_20550 [Chloroflexia bacterium]|nr:hypothetical protein [Chloroflexia bacterium]
MINKKIAVASSIIVPCQKEAALAAAWEIKNIEYCEVKAYSVEVHPENDKTGTYNVFGRFAGVPWRNTFRYVLHDRGFHSLEASPPPEGSRIHGGFFVEPFGENDSLVIHYEQYVLPARYLLLKPLILLYLKWSMGKELRTFRQLVMNGKQTALVNS